MSPLDGTVALVTGASSGIGAATARTAGSDLHICPVDGLPPDAVESATVPDRAHQAGGG